MTMRRNLMRATAAAALAFTLAPVVHAQDVIKIGEINSYTAQPAVLEPYKKGMELAVDEINASGGVLGKKVQLVIRDDNANPGDAVRAAEELVSREKVDVLTGSFLSHIGLALTDFAKQKKFFFLAGEPLDEAVEAVANAVRHGDASRLSITLRDEDGFLCLTVEDNGIGFEWGSEGGPAVPASLAGRVHESAGKIDVRSEAGRTSIMIRLPMRGDQ